MICLAIDTSQASVSAALMEDATVLAESFAAIYRERKTASETLMPMINQLFLISGRSINEVERLACTCGPGSFTGLRIGAATAKGLAFALEIPLIAVPTLDAMAYDIGSIADADTIIVPMMDARRGQVYTAFYQNGIRISDYTAENKENLIASLGNKKVIYTTKPLSASSVGAVAVKLESQHESKFELFYLRKPQAERERESRKLKVIDMTLDHLDAVYEIETSSFAIPWTKNDLRKDITENKHSIYKVAVTDTGKVVGYAGLWHVVNEGQINNIAVSSEYRRMGAASKLIEAIASQAKELEMIGLTLEVRVSNHAAISLYEKHGFKAEGLRKRYYKDTGEDAIIMWKYFESKSKSKFEERLNEYLISQGD